MQEVQLKRTDL